MFLYDKVIVIDIEATCWEKGQIPDNQKREIIEIGICKLNMSDGNIEKKLSDKTDIFVSKRILYSIDRNYSRKIGKRRSFF